MKNTIYFIYLGKSEIEKAMNVFQQLNLKARTHYKVKFFEISIQPSIDHLLLAF